MGHFFSPPGERRTRGPRFCRRVPRIFRHIGISRSRLFVIVTPRASCLASRPKCLPTFSPIQYFNRRARASFTPGPGGGKTAASAGRERERASPRGSKLRGDIRASLLHGKSNVGRSINRGGLSLFLPCNVTGYYSREMRVAAIAAHRGGPSRARERPSPLCVAFMHFFLRSVGKNVYNYF